LHGFLFAS